MMMKKMKKLAKITAKSKKSSLMRMKGRQNPPQRWEKSVSMLITFFIRYIIHLLIYQVSNSSYEYNDMFSQKYQITWQTFKTEKCKKCPQSPLSSILVNYLCPYYHSKLDQRRSPYNQKYSAIYLEDSYNPNHCLNVTEYLYHPDNYRRLKCQRDCKKEFNICPYYHNSKQMQQKIDIPDDFSVISKDLDQLLASIHSSQETVLTLQLSKQESKKDKKLQELASEIKDISSINDSGLFKDELAYTPTQYYYQGAKVSFRESRNHQFKQVQQINFSHIIPMIFQYMCAFMNAEGGTLYIGIDDFKVVKGVRLTEKDIDKLMLEIDNGSKQRFSPPVLPQKYKLDFVKVRNQKTQMVYPQIYVIEIHMSPNTSEVPYLYNRQYYMRLNASNHRFLAAEIIQNQKLKCEQKLSKGLQMQRGIINADTKYFQKMTTDDLMMIKDRLNSTTQLISKIISQRKQ